MKLLFLLLQKKNVVKRKYRWTHNIIIYRVIRISFGKRTGMN